MRTPRLFRGACALLRLGLLLTVGMCFAGPVRAEVVRVLLQQEGVALAGQTIQAYTAEGTDLKLSATTDAAGNARFDLPLSSPVKFRYSRWGGVIWSDQVSQGGTLQFSVPRDTVVTAAKSGLLLTNRPVYLYDEQQHSLGYSNKTDSKGIARFCLPAGGRYQFRIDNGRVPVFSEVVAAPADVLIDLPANVTVQVRRAGQPCPGLLVKMYAEDGTYTGVSVPTNATGDAVFSTTYGRRVMFSTVCDGRELFTKVYRCPITFPMNLPEATKVVVLRDGNPVVGCTVSARSESGDDLQYSRVTADGGVASFCLDLGTKVRFSASASGAEGVSELVVAPGSASIALQPTEPPPELLAAQLVGTHFERGQPFTLELSGRNIAAGSVSIDFFGGSEGAVSELPLSENDGRWLVSGVVPREVPVVGGVGEQSNVPVVVRLRNSIGTEVVSNLTLPLLNDGNPPSIGLDQPAVAVIDAASTPLSGAVSGDTVALSLVRGASEPQSLAFAAQDGRFATELPMLEGANVLELVARDFLGNERRLPLEFTRPLGAPVIAIASPADFDQPIGANVVTVTGTVTDASPVQFSVNGNAVPLGSAGAFSYALNLANEGANLVRFEAVDAVGQRTAIARSLYRLTVAPELEISSPAAVRTSTQSDHLTISGTVGTTASKLLVNGEVVGDFSTGSFSHSVALAEGENTIEVVATDAVGNSSSDRRTVILDRTAPTLAEVLPASGYVTKIRSCTISGRVVDGVSLSIGGASVALGANGAFSQIVTLVEGRNTLALVTKDEIGNAATKEIVVHLDTIAPALAIDAPRPDSTLAAAEVEVVGSIDDPTAVLTINGKQITTDSGVFRSMVPLPDPKNEIQISATDQAGNLANRTIAVFRDNTPPVLAFTTPTDGTLSKTAAIRVAGTVDDAKATVLVNGYSAAVSAGRFEVAALPLVEGRNQITATATDTVGNQASPVSLIVTADFTAPTAPTFDSPPAFTKSDRVVLRGSSEPVASVALEGGLAPVAVAADELGHFTGTVLLPANTSAVLVATATDRAGNSGAPASLTVVTDSLAPTIAIDLPAASATIKGNAAEVTGSVSDSNPPDQVTVNGTATALAPDGRFGCRVNLAAGAQTITVSAADRAGNSSSQQRAVVVAPGSTDDAPPRITVVSPAYDAKVSSTTFSTTVLVVDDSPVASITIGGTPIIDADGDGLVTADVTVGASGEFIVGATNANDLSASVTHRVQVDGLRPQAPKIDRVSPASPTNESTVVVYGSAAAGLAYELTGGLADRIAGTVSAEGRLAISVPLNLNRSNHLELTVRSSSGLVSDPAVTEVIHDSVAPTVESTAPADGAVGIARNLSLSVVFSEVIRSVDLAGITVTAGGASIQGTKALAADGRTLTFTPAVLLPEATAISLIVPASLRDVAGNAMGRENRITFTTVDTSAPGAPVLEPVAARTNLATITISGSAESGTRIDIRGGETDVFGSVSADGRFSVMVTLRANATNALTVTATDAGGNVSPSVTATVAHDNRALAIVSSVPVGGATGVALDTPITVTFSKPISGSTLDGVALVSGTVVPSMVSVDGATITLVPTQSGSAAPLEGGKTYEIVLPATLTDLFGNRLTDGARLSFATGATTAPAAPIVYDAQPNGATNRTAATINGFATPGTKLLVAGGPAPFEYPEGDALIPSNGLFTINVPLKAETLNVIELRVRDGSGLVSAPTTALRVTHDTVHPTVLSTSPIAGATGVDPRGPLFIEFSEAVQAAPLSAGVPAIRLVDADNVVVGGSWILDGAGRGATFYPAASLSSKTAYLVRVGTSVRDLAGNALAEAFAFAFTTGTSVADAKPTTPVLDMLPARTSEASVRVSGSAPDGALIRIFGGARAVETNAAADGRFSLAVPLVPLSPNSLAVIAVVDEVSSEPALATVLQVQPGSGVRILAPLPDRTYYFGGVSDSGGNPKAGVTVAGVLDDPDQVTGVKVNGTAAVVLGRYFFCPLNLPPAAGPQSVSVAATLGDSTTITEAVSFHLQQQSADPDAIAPMPHFIFPEEGSTLNGEFVECLVTVEEGVQLTAVDIDRVVAHEVTGNVFFLYAKLGEQGANTITVRAVDAANNEGTASVGVVLDSVGFDTPPVVTTSLPSWTDDRVITLAGTGVPGSTIIVANGLVPVRTTVAGDGSFSIDVPLAPNAENHLQLVASDAAGNLSSVVSIDLVQDDTPPAIVSTSPAGEASGVAQNAAIEIVFTEPLAPESVTAAGAVTLRSALNQNLGSALACNVLLSADGKTLRIVPGYKFLRGDTITVALAATIADLRGFTLGAPYAFQFRTVAHQTTVSGIVVDENLQPLANVKVGLKGTSLTQLTSSFGTFLLDDAPVGDQLLTVDARPNVATGIPERADGRSFNYLEFFLPVRLNVDNSLGRPIFMVATDQSTATQPTQAASAEPCTLAFAPAEKDLAGFSLIHAGGSVRFADGTTRGQLTATRIDASNIPDRLPSGAIPHFLVELGPDGLSFSQPARLTFPNVYNLAAGAEVIVFHFKYGVHNYAELGRATVGADGRIVTGPLLTEGGFVGIVPADASYDLTRNILEGRVVDADGKGLAGISVNAIAGDTYVVTDANGQYSIPLPDVRLAYLRTYATVTTNVGARAGESPSLVFESAKVALHPSGVTKVPDIVVDSFFLAGDIRYVDAEGKQIPVTGLAYNHDGRLVSVDQSTANGVEILVYRRLNAVGTVPEYDSEPYLRTTAGLERLDDQFEASYLLSFLGSLKAGDDASVSSSGVPKPGDSVKIVAFDRKTGFYGERDLVIPSASAATEGSPLDVIANIELRPPQVSLDINRVFFLDGVRRRVNLPHRGIAFTDDEYVEVRTIWRTPAAVPLPRAELALTGRLRVRSVDYQNDYGFTVRGGEQFRVLELREALASNRLSILQRETDVGIETFSVSRDGSFAAESLVPLAVRTSSYGLQADGTTVDATPTKAVELYILQLALSGDSTGLDFAARFLPKQQIRVAGREFVTGADGIVKGRVDGATGTVQVGAGDSLDNAYGEILAPHINELNEQPPGLVPSRGGQGTAVVVTGRNFSPVATDNKVDFDGAVAVVTAASETRLEVTVPELASSGDVTVTVAGKKSNGVRFEFNSIGINNGSFEDGTLRAFTVEGSGRVVERWNRVLPTHRQYMAFLDTMSDPRDGVSTLTSDAFEVPEGMQTLLFDYQFVATALTRPVVDTIKCELLVGEQVVAQPQLFSNTRLGGGIIRTGFSLASDFRTLAVPVADWAGSHQQVRVRLTLHGRGELPQRMPDTDRFDANPIALENQGGTGLFLDNFRLSSGQESALPGMARGAIAAVVSEESVVISGAAETLPEGARVYVRCLLTGREALADVDQSGGFVVEIPFSSVTARGLFQLTYATADQAGAGRRYGPVTLVEVRR